MTNKEPKTVSLDPENAEFLTAKDNASKYVDRLLTQARKGGSDTTAALELQIMQKKREKRNAERRAENLAEDIKELEQLKQGLKKQDTAELEQAKKELRGIPRDVTNPAIKNWADKLGMTPEQLLDELEEEEAETPSYSTV